MLSAAETSAVLAAVCSNQSASANALHHPFGLISPSTTLQDLGGSNNVQVAHMRTSFGLSWYSASFFDIFSRARTQDIAADANQAATLANAARSSLRRKTRLSVMDRSFWHSTSIIAANVLSHSPGERSRISNCKGPPNSSSALGQGRSSGDVRVMSAFPPMATIADIASRR